MLDAGRRASGGSPGENIRSGYTGHEHDRELGVINMRGRWYHPLLRRFLSPDPLAGGDGQRLNRYSYVRNSPFAFTDPSGWGEQDDLGGVTGPLPAKSECRESCDVPYTTIINGQRSASAGDSVTSESAGAGASGTAPSTSSADPTDGGPPVGVPAHVPDGYGGGEPPGRDTQEAIAAGRGFAAGVGEAVVGAGVALGVAGAIAALSPLIVTGAALYMGYATVTGAGDAYDGFLEVFETASVPNAPLEYHEAAGAALGGLMAAVWTGALMDAGLGLAAPVAPELSTITAEMSSALDAGAGGGGATLRGFHGAVGDSVLGVMDAGGFIPQNGRVFLSEIASDTFVHGADIARRAAFSIEVDVEVGAASAVSRIAVPGNPRTILIESADMVPAVVRRLLVRTRTEEGGFAIKSVEGEAAIRSFLGR